MLELKNICFSAKDEKTGGGQTILRDISLVLDEKFIVLTGPNGGGKSTIARIIAGIEKPDSGRIFFDGRDITDLSVTERARAGISYAFQQPVKFKGITVRKLLSIAAGKKLSAEETDAFLREVGLSGPQYAEREVNASLSGGELKRVEIATLLARSTEFSVFDEPEAGIDLWSFKSLISVFEDLRNKMHGTIFVISHQERILNIADRIIVLADGRIVRDGGREILPELLEGTYPAPTGKQEA